MASTSRRLGCFFYLVAAVTLIVFLASQSARRADYNLLLIGLSALLLGWALWRRGRPEPRPSGRFRLLRRHRASPEDEDPAAGP